MTINPAPRSRLRSIDCLRGTAMALVIVQHVFHMIAPPVSASAVGTLIYLITRGASVAFVFTAGMMLALYMSRAADKQKATAKTLKRVFLLLLIIHPLIPLVRYSYFQGDRVGHLIHNILYDFPVTDTIAICLALCLPLLRLKASIRLGIGIALLIATPVLVLLFASGDSVLAQFTAVLFGEYPGETIVFPWPIAPWLGIFLIGLSMGEKALRSMMGEYDVRAVTGDWFRLGLKLFLLGASLICVYLLAKTLWRDQFSSAFWNIVYPSRTTAFLPIYLGLAAWTHGAIVWCLYRYTYTNRPLWMLSVFGRSSLFTYVIQFAFAQSIPGMFGLPGHVTLSQYVGITAGVLVLTWLCSYAYCRIRKIIKADDYAVWTGV